MEGCSYARLPQVGVRFVVGPLFRLVKLRTSVHVPSSAGAILHGWLIFASLALVWICASACIWSINEPQGAESVDSLPGATDVVPSRSGPPPRPWQVDGFVARSTELSISVHQVVVAVDVVTVLYSVELAQPPGYTADFVPTARLVSDEGAVEVDLMNYKTLFRADGVSVGAMTFGVRDFSGSYITLLIDRLLVRSFSDGSVRQVVGPWEIPLIRKRSPTVVVSGFRFHNFEGRRFSDGGSVELTGDLSPHYETPMGRVALVLQSRLSWTLYKN